MEVTTLYSLSFKCPKQNDLSDFPILEKAVEDHLKGKKHLRLVSLQESRQQQTQRSIFVGGLSRINGEVQLGDYFSKFGDVARIIIDKDKVKLFC